MTRLSSADYVDDVSQAANSLVFYLGLGRFNPTMKTIGGYTRSYLNMLFMEYGSHESRVGYGRLFALYSRMIIYRGEDRTCTFGPHETFCS